MDHNWLDRIIPAKRKEIEATRRSMPRGMLEDRIANSPVPPSFPGSILRFPPGIIAEIKRKSPSAGEIRRHADRGDVIRLAQTYERGGAAAISVLTDSQFFGGSWKDLEAVHAEVEVPVLMKDFIVDEYQLYLAEVPRFFPSYRHFSEPEEITICPRLLKKGLFGIAFLLILIGLLELVEGLHAGGLLPVFFQIY